jgi:hypothetical protein
MDHFVWSAGVIRQHHYDHAVCRNLQYSVTEPGSEQFIPVGTRSNLCFLWRFRLYSKLSGATPVL